MSESNPKVDEETAITDVRRIREQLHRESNGDITRHALESNRVLEMYREKLGLKIVTTSPRTPAGKSN